MKVVSETIITYITTDETSEPALYRKKEGNKEWEFPDGWGGWEVIGYTEELEKAYQEYKMEKNNDNRS